jgi:hypothetical protein
MSDEKPHEISLTLASATSSTASITASLTVTASDGEVLHAYDMNEHDFVRLLRGGVIRVYDETDAMRRQAGA